ncbi:MAG TPA: LysM peptidoglycan-binding domain-containing protein [Candidatus Saccharimonas sp.]|jgi:surface antigen/LysM repeat protein|nr:LysM peptidoglycan-binding domain-containing protein [Candidatus Saccharimonas sp.]
MIIRNQPSVAGKTATNQIETYSQPAVGQSLRPRASLGSVSGVSIASYFGVFLLVVSMIVIGYRPPVNASLANAGTGASGATASSLETGTSVDQVMAANVAATLAESADLAVTNNVANLSQSLSIESTLAQTDTNVISKPQILQPAADSRVTQKYTTVAGDTVPLVAQRYGVSTTTIKWANKLTSDALEPGRELTIPPVDGIIYTVKSGDTIASIAAKYGADAGIVRTFNDLELTGDPAAGAQIIIPGGALPTEEQPGYVAPRATVVRASYSGGYGTGWTGGWSAGNRYAWGNCTWYAYERRMQLGNPVGSFWGNASTWAYSASAAGYLVDGNPTPGAVMQNGGGAGHVAIIEAVNPGVSVTISEMNGYRFGGGYARVGHGDISWGEATSGMYRYIH